MYASVFTLGWVLLRVYVHRIYTAHHSRIDMEGGQHIVCILRCCSDGCREPLHTSIAIPAAVPLYVHHSSAFIFVVCLRERRDKREILNGILLFDFHLSRLCTHS